MAREMKVQERDGSEKCDVIQIPVTPIHDTAHLKHVETSALHPGPMAEGKPGGPEVKTIMRGHQDPANSTAGQSQTHTWNN